MNTENIYLEIINKLRDGIYFVDKDRKIIFWNKAAEKITGYMADEIVGKRCFDTNLQHIDAEGRSLCKIGCQLYSTLDDGKQRKQEVFVRHKDGHRIPIKVNIYPIKENGGIIGAIDVFTPNSPNVYEEELIEKLANSATRDRLTGLPNRVNIESYAEYCFSEMKRFSKKFCFAFMDIDNFSNFNNTYGHELGDEVLKTVSKSIMHMIRRSDMFGRWGGEEFVGIYEIKHNKDALSMAEKMRVLIENSIIEHEGKNLSVTASLGVTIANEMDTLESAIRRADGLMYKSKQNGKNCVTAD